MLVIGLVVFGLEMVFSSGQNSFALGSCSLLSLAASMQYELAQELKLQEL
jgi:hypothetical protein